MQQIDDIILTGRSVLRAFQRGAIPALIENGLGLAQAMNVAHAMGYEVFTSDVSNLVVAIGKELIGDLAAGNETIGLTYHALGTLDTAPAATDTQLGAEAARKAWTTRTRTGNQVILSAFYTAAQCTYNIKEEGVFGGSTASATANSGKLFSHYLQNYDNSAGAVDLTFEYTLTIN